MIAALAEQWLGFGLVCAFAGFVIADLTRPKKRRVRAEAEDSAKPAIGAESSERP